MHGVSTGLRINKRKQCQKRKVSRRTAKTVHVVKADAAAVAAVVKVAHIAEVRASVAKAVRAGKVVEESGAIVVIAATAADSKARRKSRMVG